MTTWTTPRTWVAAETPSAATFNTHIRDNMLHLHESRGWALGFPTTADPRAYTQQMDAQVANRCYYQLVRGSGTVANLAVHVAVSAGTIGLAVYSSTGEGRARRPVTRTATSGSVACPAIGYASVSVGGSVAVASGEAWFAWSASGTSAALQSVGNPAASASASGIAGYQDTAHPPPAAVDKIVASFAGAILIGI